MTRAKGLKRACLLGLVGIVWWLLFEPHEMVFWDGGFSSLEVRLALRDGAGRPVPGAALRVETQAGGTSFLYPVNEFLPDRAPVSDAEGRLVFHHVSSGPEFGGRAYRNRLGVWSGNESAAPRYVCALSVGGREVDRFWFNDLYAEATHGPNVMRTWRHPDWPLLEFLEHQEDWDSHCLRLFDCNHDGQLDREERVVRSYFVHVANVRMERETQDASFRVVEKTVTVRIP